VVEDQDRAADPDAYSFSGTPEYMAQELIEGRRGDRRTDIYAVGIMMFEMLTGDVPFHGDNNLAVAAQHIHARVPRLDRMKEDISAQIAGVVERCLQRAPGSRYPGMRELIADLENLDAVDVTRLNAVTAPADPVISRRLSFLAPSALAGFMIAVMALLGFLLHLRH
jgi:serine/threonine-protein kinase